MHRGLAALCDDRRCVRRVSEAAPATLERPGAWHGREALPCRTTVAATSYHGLAPTRPRRSETCMLSGRATPFGSTSSRCRCRGSLTRSTHWPRVIGEALVAARMAEGEPSEEEDRRRYQLRVLVMIREQLPVGPDAVQAIVASPWQPDDRFGLGGRADHRAGDGHRPGARDARPGPRRRQERRRRARGGVARTGADAGELRGRIVGLHDSVA